MSRLYPPVTEEVLSAFCLSYDDDGNKTGVSININFNLNKAVANSEINGMALRLRTISTNQYVITENIEINASTNLSEGIAAYYDLTDGECIFQITSENNQEVIDKLKVGQYYKAQIAFIDTAGSIGYWSNVATIKCVARPSVTIANFDPTDANIFSSEIIGEYIQDTSTGDSSEKVYSYRFQLYDDEDNLIEDTGVQLHNSSYDTSANSSTDTFFCSRELDEEKNYYLIYSVTTINGLKISSAIYQVIAANLVDPEVPIILNAIVSSNSSWHPSEEGLVKLYLSLPENSLRKTLTGNYSISRSSAKDNFTTWEQIAQFRLVEANPKSNPVYDYTVEQGVTYHYAVQQFNRQQFYSKKIYALNTNGEILDVKVNFEDMFLYDGKRQLKVKFNPKVSSFKNDLQEQKIDTIGSKHPFIFRNGNICYKEFPISGLISFQMDENSLFITDEDYEQMELERFEENNRLETSKNNKQKTIAQKITNFSELNKHWPLYMKNSKSKYVHLMNFNEAKKKFYNGEDIYYFLKDENANSQSENLNLMYSKTNLTFDNIASERYFKLLVLDWLTDGKPKIFRSPTEGNYIVRLLNVSLTPKVELGRMIHEFSCTAYEIADFNNKNLEDLGFLSYINLNEVEYAWYSQNLKNIFEQEPDNNGYYQLPLNQKKITAFECLGFSPNDRIKIILEDEPQPLEILIGTTGTYIYDEGKTVIGISFLLDRKYEDFPRDIRLKAKGYVYQKFDTVSSVNLQTKIGEQFVGPRDNLLEKCTVGIEDNYYNAVNLNLLQDEGNKLKVSEILYLKAKKREVIPIFYISQLGIANNNLDYSLSQALADQKEPLFYLTPYGQGYINGKAIVPPTGDSINGPTMAWSNNKYFNIEDMEKALTIHDLVKITNTNKLLDEFCLFEIYLPYEKDGTLSWVPYIEAGFKGVGLGVYIQGIFDPWLYKYQQERTTEKNNIYLGWWPRPEHKQNFNNVAFPIPREKIEEYYGNGYETKLTFTYSSSQEQVSTIELKDKKDLVLKNISAPDAISCSNGITLEMIYRVQETNYTLEIENNNIKQLKTNYLTTVDNAAAKMKSYNIAKFYKYLGNKLIEKYSTELSQLQNANTYKNIIRYLVDEAREQQINKIKNYLETEKNIVNSTYYQLKAIEPYPDDQDYTLFLSQFLSQITLDKNNYDSNVNAYFENIEEDNIIYTIDEIKGMDSNFANEVTSQINNIIQYFTQQNGMLNTIQLFSGQLTRNVQDIQKKLKDLENQKFVESYLKVLVQKAKDLYLSFDSEINDYSYNLCYKNLDSSIEQTLTDADILDSVWDDTFFFDKASIPSLIISDNERTEYLDIINKYSNRLCQQQQQDGEEEIFLYKVNEESKIITQGLEELKRSLENINFITNSSDNTEMNSEKYNEKYEPFIFSKDVKPYYYDASNNNTYTDNNKLTLMEIGKLPQLTSLDEFCPAIGNINTNSLEYYLDMAYAQTKSMDIDILIQEMSNNREQIINLPNKFKFGNEEEATLKNYLNYYFMVNNENGLSLRSIYKEIQACATYYNVQKDTLTDDQKVVIEETIKKLINSYNLITISSDSDELLINKLEEAKSDFFQSIYNWNLDYAKVFEQNDDNPEQRQAIIDFNNAILNFNTSYVNKINTKIQEFLNYREEYRNLQQNYNASDNIKEILEESKENYEETITQLNSNYNFLINVLSNNQNQAILAGYIDFLNTYFAYIKQFNYEDSYEKLQQSLLEAEGMYSAKINEEDSPYKQQEEICKSWKKYIDALKEVYTQEVKERFD